MSENDSNAQDQEDNKDTEDTDTDTGADDDAGNDDDKGDEGKGKGSDRKEEAPEDRLARLRRQVAREEKKLGLNKEEPKSQNKSGEFGLVEKTYLRAEGIKGADEIKLVKEFMKNTGKELDAVVESKYFQAELKELRDSQASADAVPKGKNRSGQTARDSVEYWVAKGELPKDNPELARKVVNAKMKAATTGNVFTSQPVIGG